MLEEVEECLENLALDAAFSAEDEIMRITKGVLDRLNMEITTWFTRLRNLDYKILDAIGLMHCVDVNQLRDSCTRLGNFYDTDVDGLKLFNEICDCKCF